MNKKVYTVLQDDHVLHVDNKPKESVIDTMTDNLTHVGDTLSNGISSVATAVEESIQNVIPTEKASRRLRSFSRDTKKAITKPVSMLENKIEQAVSEFNESLPILQEAGFKLESIDIEVSSIPKLIPCFSLIHKLDEASKESLLKKHKSNRMISLLLKTLFHTEFLASLSIGNLTLREIEIHLGTIPKAKVRFTSI